MADFTIFFIDFFIEKTTGKTYALFSERNRALFHAA